MRRQQCNGTPTGGRHNTHGISHHCWLAKIRQDVSLSFPTSVSQQQKIQGHKMAQVTRKLRQESEMQSGHSET